MSFSISDIFKDVQTQHELTLFSPESIKLLEKNIFEKNGKPYLKCLVSDRDRQAKPEEVVRQLWLRKIMEEYHYPKERIKVEHPVWFGSGVSEKSADIIIMHEDGEHPYIIFEVKKPKRKDGIQQLKSYCNAEGSPIGVWSNGEELVILHRQEPNIFTHLSSIPTAGQTLQDIITEQWTIDKLISENKIVKERLPLKKIILDLENLVLANAEGIDDSFDEIFKLIYAKLYDEWAAINDRSRQRKIHFRIYGESPNELYNKINGLFNQAKNKWRGVFGLDERIKLKPNHLLTCVSFLQDIQLFNSDLRIIDDAFEYLSTEVAKGKKGQYFTPRWVIDMCVKMLNPKVYERVLDPACGSCGFTVHTIFWVWGNKDGFGIEGPSRDQSQYAAEMIYGIDSSPRAVKIAKALNLIAGDGKSNVYELNSLNPPKWSEEGKAAFRPLLTRFIDDPAKDEDNQKNFQYFDFDVVLTNPPFAGNINEKQILKQYELAEKNGKTATKMGRDILFIERCLKFLRPGGRMAIVLPQGRLNNINDMNIRKYLFEQGRILAVVGLHVNTFKPHTSTKTSVIFIQKYTSDEIKKREEILNRHSEEWEAFISEIRKLNDEKAWISEDELPENLNTFLKVEFEEIDNDEEIEDEGTSDYESDEELEERIENLENQLKNAPKRFKGKADLIRTLNEARRKLASRSLKGRLNWLLEDEKLLRKYRSAWLSDRAAKELDYPIFFAVSEKSGKDNSGNPVLIPGENGELVVDHDLDDIANKFIAFAKEQGFDFWAE
jgi:type I restriction enzyme M protein